MSLLALATAYAAGSEAGMFRAATFCWRARLPLRPGPAACLPWFRRTGKYTETFSNRGSALLSGEYSVHLNVYNSKTTLMLEGKETLILPSTRTLVVDFNPTQL